MKRYLALCFFLVSCGFDNNDSPSVESTKINLSGQCSDLETPSRYKEAGTYDVMGWFTIWHSDDLRTFGYLSVTGEQMRELMESLGDYSDYDGDFDQWLAQSDTPSIDIWEIPSTALNETQWNFESIHNYDDTGETNTHYADRRGQCSLKVESIEGEIPIEIFEKETLCFSSDCNFKKNF